MVAAMIKAVLLLALAVTVRGQDEDVPPVISGKLPPGTPAATIADAGSLSKFQVLLDAALATEPLSNTTQVTILAPSDEAVAAFLKELGIEEADIANNEPLADAIVAYHTIIGATLGPKELFADSNKVAVPTAADKYKVVFTKTPTGVTVTDVQGNTANVIKAGLGTGKHQVHIIDKVLWSGTYWKDLASLIKALPSQVGTFAAAAKAAGLDKVVLGADFSDTLLIPTNSAFKQAKISLDEVKPDDLKKVLTYHVIPAPHTLPSGFDSGKPIATLEGTDVTVTYIKEGSVASDKKANFFRAVVRDGQDNHATIIKPNLFYGKNVAHIIDQVLLLPKPAEKKGNRKLLQATHPLLSLITFTPAAGFTLGKPAAAASAGGAAAGKPAAPEKAEKPAGSVEEVVVLEVTEVADLKKLDLEVYKAATANGPFVETKDKKGKKGNTQAVFHEDAKKYTAAIQDDLAKLAAPAPAAAATKPAAKP